MSGQDPAFLGMTLFNDRGDRVGSLHGLTKREWLVGQLLSGPLMGQGAIPPLKEIWKLADKILAAGTHADSPPDSL